ncbi:MAG: hypothetical protein AAF959_07915 [Cyanobacteria bacterium P01_D01_bin.56]
MKDLQQSTLLEQELDFRAARTLCRDGWSCEQINVVLKHVAISQEQFHTIQAQSRELDELQKDFGAPADSMSVGHKEPSQSELDFLNRGPDAAADVLREKGWSKREISLVIQDTMFPSVEMPKAKQQAPNYAVAPPVVTAVPPAFQTQGRNGYALGHPDAGIATLPYPTNSQARPRRGARSTLVRDTLILAFMAGIALALVFTLL